MPCNLEKPDVSEEHMAPIVRAEAWTKKETSKKQAASRDGSLLGLLFNLTDGGFIFLLNVGIFPNYTTLQARRTYS
jgi:hypothetical protein